MSIADVQIYNRFLHTFTDRTEQAYLVSLRVGGFDLGEHARFCEPQFNEDRTKFFTYELKWVGPLESRLAVTGWNRRALLVDLIKSKFQIGSWERLPDSTLSFRPDFAPLGFFWKALSGFQSPATRKLAESEDASLIDWNLVRKVHFSKRAINTFEIPHLEAEIKIGDSNTRYTLSTDPNDSILQTVIAKEWILPKDLAAFLESSEDSERSIFANLGEIKIPSQLQFDIEKARQGLYENGVLHPWASIKPARHQDVVTFESANIGGMIIQNLAVSPEYGAEARSGFPAQRFHFHFSKINGAETRESMVAQLANWKPASAAGGGSSSDYKVDFNPEWSQFFSLETAVINLRLSYSNSEGFGGLDLDDEFYRQLLLENPRFVTSFSPDQSLAFKNAGLRFESAYGFVADEVSPAPDALKKSVAHFWREKQTRQGATVEGFLYTWSPNDLESINAETSDEYGDRGGPYEDIVFTFHGEGLTQLRLRRTGEIDLAKLRAFFKASY